MFLGILSSVLKSIRPLIKNTEEIQCKMLVKGDLVIVRISSFKSVRVVFLFVFVQFSLPTFNYLSTFVTYNLLIVCGFTLSRMGYE